MKASRYMKWFVAGLVMAMVLTSLLGAYAKPAKEAKWWEEKWGVPQYGGRANRIVNILGDQFDPWFAFTAHWYIYERLFEWNWYIDRAEWAYKTEQAPQKCYNGLLAESWDWEDPKTMVVNLKQGVKWHDRKPTNGRELTADDVIWHYDRQLGTGSGFTKPNPFSARNFNLLANVTKRDDYTVAFNFKEAMPLANWWCISAIQTHNMIEPREILDVDAADYHYACGTGAFMVTDFISGTSLTLKRNPNYHQYDKAYPENRLPYLDEIKLLFILDISTQVAALRSGKADLVFGLPWQIANSIKKTNPEIIWTTMPVMGTTLELRNDREPFTDIRVRKAMQLAIDIPTIAKTHLGGYVSGDPPNMLADEYKGWTRPYSEWPEDIRQEYTYDPDKARKLVAEAGYPDGFNTNIIIQANEDAQLFQIIKAYLAEIGINMEISIMERLQFIPYVQAGKHDQIASDFLCNMIFSVDGAFSNGRTSGPMNSTYPPADEVAVYDDLYAQFLAAPDEATAQKLGFQMQDYFYRQHWAIIGPGSTNHIANSSRLKGYDGESLASFPMTWFMKHWWIDETQ